MRAWGVSLEVGVGVGLLTEDSWGQGREVAKDLDDGLELASDVVLHQAGGDHRCPPARVTIEQRPVVEHQAFTVLQVATAYSHKANQEMT